ncbi:peptidylprolyl isomerase [Cytobacillus gottheilii]|uniref:peptidylprolyl isomerase n=1 Tax=Cytobacillus gottheilii TaxID=859144 RepID=UPI0009BC58BA|nr:peptidylprolyl isomerase [Cytobacillus gottheilii]
MKKWVISFSLAAGVLGLSACSSGGSDAVVETGNGDITKDELYEAMKEKYGEQTLRELVYEKVLSENYEVSDEELNEQIDELKQQLGANFELALQQYGYQDEDQLRETLRATLLQEKAAVKDVEVTEEEVQEYYDNYQPRIKARHILVEDEATATEVKQKLDDGGNFEELATEYSQDPGSAANGGDLGWFGQGQMVAEFEEAAYALDVDQISEPVQSQHGFHIIQVTEKEEKKSFDEMKDDMEYDLKVTKLQQDPTIVQAALDRELKDANVDIKDEDLKGIISDSSAADENADEEGADESTEESETEAK